MKRTIFIVVLLLSVTGLRAQQLTSYTCDFENPAENAQWVMNISRAGLDMSQCANKWYIGDAGGFGMGSSQSSSKGLYISSGTGADTLVSSYSSRQSVFVTAARELQLAVGTYSVVFDWQAMGSDARDGVYVFWVDSDNPYYNTLFANYNDRATIANLPPYVTNTTRYGNSTAWRSSAFTFTTAGNGGKLVVLWFNTKTPEMPPAGKVDNITIYQGPTCPAPTNVKYDGTNLSWSGNASSYDVKLYNYHTQTLYSFTGITGNSMQMPNINEEGYYYIYVRSSCDAGHSVWVYTEKFVWIKGARCIDLFDITADNSGAAKCFYGTTDNIKVSTGALDLGPENELSQHTIHYKQGERDPRTGNQLKTIPDGEIASVRLGGHWLSDGNMSSTVEYEYNVQAGVSDILELKYAAILEYADYHGEDEEARFKLEVLRNGQIVSPCAQGDFKAGFGETSQWHSYTYQYGESASSTRDILWCDWQTISVSLRDYVGQKLTIRLTAYSCTATIHIGYAYFTLNCKGGDLQGIACGDFSTDHFEAPEGFNYRWYKEDEPDNILGTQQTFGISASDTSIYLVDLISKTKSQCYYTLEANPNPRFPQAKGKMLTTKAANCQQTVDFEQDCKVVRINRLHTWDSVYTDEPVERISWDFGDGSPVEFSQEKKVSHVYPAEGGTYNVTVTAEMSNGVCADPYTFTITLPDITTPDTHEAIHYCEEGTNRSDTTTLKNGSGCEYLQIKDHFYHSTYDTTYTDRICEGGRYFFPGDKKYYTVTTDTTLQLRSVYGCDSLISLKLIVDPKLEVEYPHSVKACLEDGLFSMPYRTISGSMDSIKIYFSAEDQQQGFEPVYRFANGEEVIIPLPASARPDIYDVEVEFGGERCQMEIQPLQLMVTYPTSIVMQNGGFIATQNADYNGGHEFVSFTWYKDGEKLDHTASYLPTSPSDIGSTFVLSLMRAGEDYAVESCPILYSPATQGIDLLGSDAFRVWPTSVEGGGTVYRSAGAACTVYTVLGTPVASFPKTDVVSSFAAPSQSGMYIVVFDNHQSLPIIVR